MGLLTGWTSATAVVDESQAQRLSSGSARGGDVVEVLPPKEDDGVPASTPEVVHKVMELQSRWKLWNESPVTCFEIRRDRPDQIRLQFVVPTKRLERKLRLHLSEAIPGVGFETGVSGVSVSAGETVGGGVLTTGRPDMFPLETECDRPPTNGVVNTLHQDAFPSERVIVQVLFQPVAGRPLREWWWKRRAFKRVGWLKKEKHAVLPWRQRPATRVEKRQADAVESKARNPQFRVGIRFLFVGTRDDLLRSRVKEVGGAYNVYESFLTNQYLDTYTAESFWQDRIFGFAEAVADRRFDRWVLPFRAGIPEVAGLVAVPCVDQENVRRARP